MYDKTVVHISWTKSACKSRKLKSTSFSCVYKRTKQITCETILETCWIFIFTQEKDVVRFSMEKCLILHKGMWQWVTVRKKAADLRAWPRRPVLVSCNPKSLCFTLILWPVYMTHSLSFKKDINRNSKVLILSLETEFYQSFKKNKNKQKQKQKTLFFPILAFSVPKI